MPEKTAIGSPIGIPELGFDVRTRIAGSRIPSPGSDPVLRQSFRRNPECQGDIPQGRLHGPLVVRAEANEQFLRRSQLFERRVGEAIRHGAVRLDRDASLGNRRLQEHDESAFERLVEGRIRMTQFRVGLVNARLERRVKLCNIFRLDGGRGGRQGRYRA